VIFAFVAPNQLAGVKELPSRLRVAKWGRNESVKGTFVVNETTARFLPAMQKAVGFDTVALDFEHNTVPETEAYKADREPRKVAAHGVPRVVPGEGLFVENLRWTPEGKASVEGGHHPDLSPAIKTNDAGEVVFLHSSALCRQGAVPDLQVFTAALSPRQLQTFSAAIAATASPAMDYKTLLLLILGLDAHASDTDITTAAQGFAKKLTAAAGQAQTIETMSSELKTLGQKFGELQKGLDEAEKAKLTAQAVLSGKIITASVSELPLEQFRKIVAELPANQVPLDQRTVDGMKAFSAGSGVVTAPTAEIDEAVRKQLGISKDDWAKA
jgi:phage I-like protein